jgi:hypothetical protein
MKGKKTSELAILVSCVGRKLMMNQRVEEEVEKVQEIIGAETVMTGFYSYGKWHLLMVIPLRTAQSNNDLNLNKRIMNSLLKDS